MLSNYNSINVDSEKKNTNTRKKSDRNYLWIGSIIFGITLIIIIITIVIGNNNNNNNTYSNYFSNIFDNIDSNNNVETGETGETVGRELVDPYIFGSYSTQGWLATGQLSDLSDGDYILIRHLRTSALLKTRFSVDKVTARAEAFTPYVEQFLWIVGYSQSKDAYTFNNVEENCYLQYDSGRLKCLSGLNDGNNGYWKSGGTDHLDGDVSSYPRYSTILKNSGNNKCPRVSSIDDNEIGMKKDHCKDYDDAGFVFEMFFRTVRDLDSINYESYSNEYTWVVAAKSGIGLSSGDIIAIRSADTSGLINNPSNTNTVKSTVTYDSDRNLWTVGYDESDDVYTFQSLEDNCYLQFNDGYLKCKSTLNDKSYWKLDGCNGQSCIVLKNDDNGKWVQTRGPLHNQYESVVSYGKNSIFRFEIVHHV